MRPILECQKLTKNTETSSRSRTWDLSLERGKIVGLLGPNGSGKDHADQACQRPAHALRRAHHDQRPGTGAGNKEDRFLSSGPQLLQRPYEGKPSARLLRGLLPNFSTERALKMLDALEIDKSKRLNALSKGAQEKGTAGPCNEPGCRPLYPDEPIGGVDPAARDYILRTILSNYSENATVLISTHLITDIEQVLDHVIFLQNGQISLNASVDEIRTEYGKSVDTLFREVFKC